MNQEIKRSEGMLQNTNFLSKAPKEKIESEKKKYAEYMKKKEAYTEQWKRLK